MEKITNIRIAGLGGMGVLKASLILGELLFEEGYDVKKLKYTECRNVVDQFQAMCDSAKKSTAP